MTEAELLRAIDSNIVLRYLLRDDPAQWARATSLIDSEEPLGLTVIVLAETAWVLAGPLYQRERSLVATSLVQLLARANIIAIGFEKAGAQAALLTSVAETGAANFGDALIAACARSFGLQEIYTFDQRFGRAGLILLLYQPAPGRRRDEACEWPRSWAGRSDGESRAARVRDRRRG